MSSDYSSIGPPRFGSTNTELRLEGHLLATKKFKNKTIQQAKTIGIPVANSGADYWPQVSIGFSQYYNFWKNNGRRPSIDESRTMVDQSILEDSLLNGVKKLGLPIKSTFNSGRTNSLAMRR
jgi:hypothetical protein